MNPVGVPEISDDQIIQSQGRVRFLVMQRLEQIWATCQPHVTGQGLEEQGRLPDPRWAEIGVRVLDRLVKLYRLERPQVAVEAEEEIADEARTRAMILASLDQLEADSKSSVDPASRAA